MAALQGDLMPESSFEELSKLGLYTGMGDIYVAAIIKEDTNTEPAQTGTPQLAAEGVSFGVTPIYAEGSQPASDRTIRKVRQITGYTLRVEYPRVLAAVRSFMLGRTMDKNGGELVGDGTSPLIAVGYAAHRDDGTSHLRWFYKGRASEQDLEDRTREEGTIAYRTQVLQIDVVPTNYTVTLPDGQKVHPIRYDADTANPKCTYTEESFFESVPQYEAPEAA